MKIDVTVKREEKTIIEHVSLSLEKGKIHALMGPNGSGKSTLSHAIMGHPAYNVEGTVEVEGENILDLPVNERAKKGIFLSFQYPKEISGVTLRDFLHQAYKSVNGEGFEDALKKAQEQLQLDESFLDRYVNEGFSGGEKKKAEILQLLVLDPKIAILDETDSGLDIDALRVVAEGINAFMSKEKTVLIITHYKRILELVEPDTVSILKKGKIVETGEKELVEKLEKEGYNWLV